MMVGLKFYFIVFYKELVEDFDYLINYYYGDGGIWFVNIVE